MALVPQWDNKVISSMFYYIDHTILATGQAFTNTSSLFYKISGNISPYTIYAAPYRPFVADKSVPNATIMSGVYLNNSFITTGQSGFVDINYEKGLVYFTGNLGTNPSVSGVYSVKDFNISLTDKPDEKILFETKHFLKSRVTDTPTGLAFDNITYPILYVKNFGGENVAAAFGGLEKTSLTLRVIIMAESLWQRDAIAGILKDKARSVVGLFTASDMPFNSLGGFRNTSYDYNAVVSGKGGQNVLFIDKIRTSSFAQIVFQELVTLNTDVFVAFADIDLCGYRYPRQ